MTWHLNDDDFDQGDVDVCIGCGRYYGMTRHIEELWRQNFNYREGEPMPQLCHRCMRGDVPPHEY